MILKVVGNRSEINGCFSLILKKPNGFKFYAGQYLDVELSIDDQDKKGKSRTFTISASPTEDFLMMTTRLGVSDFKKAMAQLKPGAVITTSHPAGTFIIDETESAVFIAGGIGITPFRSMIKYALDKKLSTPITLIYSNSTDDFLFKGELATWKKNLPNLRVIYIQTSRDGRLNAQKLSSMLHSKLYTIHSIYYLAGPPKMVDDFAKMLLNLRVEEVNIRYDRFDGY